MPGHTNISISDVSKANKSLHYVTDSKHENHDLYSVSILCRWCQTNPKTFVEDCVSLRDRANAQRSPGARCNELLMNWFIRRYPDGSGLTETEIRQDIETTLTELAAFCGAVIGIHKNRLTGSVDINYFVAAYDEVGGLVFPRRVRYRNDFAVFKLIGDELVTHLNELRKKDNRSLIQTTDEARTALRSKLKIRSFAEELATAPVVMDKLENVVAAATALGHEVVSQDDYGYSVVRRSDRNGLQRLDLYALLVEIRALQRKRISVQLQEGRGALKNRINFYYQSTDNFCAVLQRDGRLIEWASTAKTLEKCRSNNKSFADAVILQYQGAHFLKFLQTVRDPCNALLFLNIARKAPSVEGIPVYNLGRLPDYLLPELADGDAEVLKPKSDCTSPTPITSVSHRVITRVPASPQAKNDASTGDCSPNITNSAIDVGDTLRAVEKYAKSPSQSKETTNDICLVLHQTTGRRIEAGRTPTILEKWQRLYRPSSDVAILRYQGGYCKEINEAVQNEDKARQLLRIATQPTEPNGTLPVYRLRYTKEMLGQKKHPISAACEELAAADQRRFKEVCHLIDGLWTSPNEAVSLLWDQELRCVVDFGPASDFKANEVIEQRNLPPTSVQLICLRGLSIFGAECLTVVPTCVSKLAETTKRTMKVRLDEQHDISMLVVYLTAREWFSILLEKAEELRDELRRAKELVRARVKTSSQEDEPPPSLERKR